VSAPQYADDTTPLQRACTAQGVEALLAALCNFGQASGSSSTPPRASCSPLGPTLQRHPPSPATLEGVESAKTLGILFTNEGGWGPGQLQQQRQREQQQQHLQQHTLAEFSALAAAAAASLEERVGAGEERAPNAALAAQQAARAAASAAAGAARAAAAGAAAGAAAVARSGVVEH